MHLIHTRKTPKAYKTLFILLTQEKKKKSGIPVGQFQLEVNFAIRVTFGAIT
jgi:hypothetical protein